MSLVHSTTETLRSPPSPSLTNPDMILPYDPRLRDSNSTQHSGPDITSLNDQMAMSLSATRAINHSSWDSAAAGGAGNGSAGGGSQRRSVPGEWDADEPVTPSDYEPPRDEAQQTTPRPSNASNTFEPGTSFLNLSRFSTISTPANKAETAQGPGAWPQEEGDEAAARNDFARAEEILANAKKRLTTMESNLTRARSLSVSRSASVASNVPDDRSFSGRLHNSTARQNGWVISAAKLRQTNGTSGGSHNRVFSENSLPQANANHLKTYEGDRPQVRSSSAMGAIHGEDQDSPRDFYGSYRGGFGRLEPLREDELLSPTGDSPRSSSRGVDRFHDLPAKARSNVQLRDLREQMQDLKGKLDSLKRQTREDSMHRRSMQYLKSPSPFTDAEAWRQTPPRDGSRQSTRHSDDTPRPGDPPKTAQSADMSGPTSAITPQVIPIMPRGDAEPLGSPGSMTGGPRGVIEGALSSLDEKVSNGAPVSPQQRAISHRPNLSGTLPLPPTLVEKSAFDPWSPQSEKAEILNADDEDEKADGSEGDVTQKEDSESQNTASSPNTELSGEVAADADDHAAPGELSHEERPDAFDYETFVISSTMGTYSRSTERSRSSSASTSTIGPDAELELASTPPPFDPHLFAEHAVPQTSFYHSRQASGGSTSSLDTFATANSRSASRLQATGSRQALREAASREALGHMPGAFIGSAAPTPAPGGATPTPSEHAFSYGPPRASVASTASGGARSDGTERPISTSFSRPRPPSTVYKGPTYSVASTTASVFSTTTAAPAIDPAADPVAVAARAQMLRTLLAHPLHPGSDEPTVTADDEALVATVLEGLQRVCGALVWSGAVHGIGGARSGLRSLRARLDAARVAMEEEPYEGRYIDELPVPVDPEAEAAVPDVPADHRPRPQSGSSQGAEGSSDRFVAL